MSYERFCALCKVVHLPSPGAAPVRQLISTIKQRLLTKSERLSLEIEGLSFEAARDVIAAACASINWRRLERAYGAVRDEERLASRAWDVIDSLAATFEPTPADIPLDAMRRVIVRRFATGIQAALQLEPPAAHDLTARLYGAKDWEELTGQRPIMSPSEPLYYYVERQTDDGIWGYLEPTPAALVAEEEVAAETALLDAESRTDIALRHFSHRSDLLAAAAIACSSAIESGRYGEALYCANKAIEALMRALPEEPAPLSTLSRSNLYWRELLGARVVLARKLGDKTQKAANQTQYALGRLEAFAPAGPPTPGMMATPLAHRSRFRLVRPAALLIPEHAN